jgi:hypothetical protein
MRGSVRRRGSTYTWYISVPDPVTGERRQRARAASGPSGSVRRRSTRRLPGCAKALSSGRRRAASAPSS